VSRRVKSLLERAKAKYERELGKRLTWNEFMERVVLRRLNVESVLELSDEEANTIMELTVKGRESWRRYV